MRYTPAAVALALVAAVSASVSHSTPQLPMNPRAAALVAEGRAALESGQVDSAVDAYEAALTIQPGSATILLHLADATRRQGMQGKALHYYRAAIEQEPANVLAIAGEGAALVEKGALEKARRNLSRLKTLCGDDCDATRQLAAAIARGPVTRIVTAEAVKPEPVVSDN
ncbi:MAG: tetratricopeptide repeat protein [Novosphingobium sp.]